MMGRMFHSSTNLRALAREHEARQSPPYKDDSHLSLGVIAKTTTTVTTTRTTQTTETTTHFFSLPSWRRKPPDNFNDSTVNESGSLSLKRPLQTEKDLPAIPIEVIDLDDPSPSKRPGLPRNSNSSRAFMPPPTTQAPSARSVLVQAALGIGLPHVMPHAAPSSPKPGFPPAITVNNAPTSVGPTIQKNGLGSPREASPVDGSVRRRLRKLSLMALKIDRPATPKADDPVSAQEPDSPLMPSLSRKSSFWRRKRTVDDPTPSASDSHVILHAPSLPLFPPVSPLGFELPGKPISPNLRRRHSERSSSFSSRSFSMDSGPRSPPPVPEKSATLSNPSIVVKSPQPTPSTPRPFPPKTLDPYSLHDRHFPPTPRPRSSTSPSALLHRISAGLFSPSNSMPMSFPTASTSVSTSKLPLTSHSGPPSPRLPTRTTFIPTPRADQESPEVFLARLEEAVSKAEIATILASKPDPFYVQALKAYIGQFDFKEMPLDIALRMLLMDVGLPRETQQIDRVMESFASRYKACNPNLFASEDHPYILAFSLIMLHTDAFNKSNKRKMTKADYIKNTKLPGVYPEILDYFFDNIVLAPFIFIEDPLDVNGQRGLLEPRFPVIPPSNQSSFLGKGNKIDPYYIIANKLLHFLRVDVPSHIPQENPYSYQGTAGIWEEEGLHHAFACSNVIPLDSGNKRASSMPIFAVNVGGASLPNTNSFTGFSELITEPGSAGSNSFTLRVTKVGLLNRKDIMAEGRRGINRKWRKWSVILTGSQLLFFRDPNWALQLIAQAYDEAPFTPLSLIKPDELVSLKDSVALYDSSHSKHDNSLLFVMGSGRQFLLQAESEQERNEWIAHINYAGAFRTVGIRMRPFNPTRSGRGRNLQRSHTLANPQVDAVSASNSKQPTSRFDWDSRIQAVRSKIEEMETKISVLQAQHDLSMRFARNLAILAPFQRTTRERIQKAVDGLAKSIMQVRLDMVKMVCHRDILSADLVAQERDQQRYAQHPDTTTRIPSSLDIPRSQSTAALAVESSHNGLTPISEPQQERSWILPSLTSPPISFNDPVSDAPEPRSSGDGDSNTVESRSSFADNSVRSFEGDRTPDDLQRPQGTPRISIEETAEEWDKTRAAKRVSLVRMPSDLRFFGRRVGRKSLNGSPTPLNLVIPEPISSQSSQGSSATTFESDYG